MVRNPWPKALASTFVSEIPLNIWGVDPSERALSMASKSFLVLKNMALTTYHFRQSSTTPLGLHDGAMRLV